MSELISRLKEIIEKYNAGCYNETCNPFESCTDCVLKQIREVIESQPPADSGPDTNVGTNQWIPCSERLPKKAHSYVVTEQTKYGRYIMSTRIFRGGKWVIEELYDDVKVIAWMPAEPYKGDKHEHD